jgi:hypothetical protein
MKFLSLKVDNHLNWMNHIEQIIPKLSAACYAIRSSIHISSNNSQINLLCILLFCYKIWNIDEFVWKISWLLIMKFNNEIVYWHGTDRQKLYEFKWNTLLQGVLDCAPAIILMIFFCNVKIFTLLEELPPKNYSIFYSRIKECTVNWFDCYCYWYGSTT